MNRIKMLRKEKDIKQDVLANLLGLEIAGVSKLETGRVPLKDEYIIKLANYFEVSTDYLLGKSDIRNPETIDSDKINIGLSTKDYTPPTEEQQKAIEEFAKLILKENKKKDKK